MTFCAFLASCCQHEYEDKEFLFNNYELSFFSAYSFGDTIYFENQFGDIDTIEIVEITPTNTDPKSACGKGLLMNPRPTNSKAIKIKHLPIDKWHGTTEQHFNDGEIKKSINYQTFLSMTKFPLEKEVGNQITFKDFHSDLALDSVRNDTLTLNHKKWSAYFVAEHAYPERVRDSLSILKVFWTVEDGLIAYETKAGLLWTKK
ncbi:hypothetical protein C9994_04925 [Marivirga lumbricoides]|uniref:Uncharacterized protein n=1 Tax=Marivirga lumbricoides TaxID=1046115 RepID=A0A2T4DT18_9BACT|nr:hypothetical protein C9994_04925 [Marivirga lumbricoides]